MSLCEYSQPLMGAAVLFLLYTLFMAVGLVMMPGNASEHFAKNRAGLADAWQKARSRTWQAPIFAISFPILLLGILPMAFPLVAVTTGFGALLLGWWLNC